MKKIILLFNFALLINKIEAQQVGDTIVVKGFKYGSTTRDTILSFPNSNLTFEKIILRYNMRSQIYAKSLPMPMVVGSIKRLEMIRTQPEHKDNLWKIVHALQGGLKEAGFNIGITTTPVTPVLLNGTIPEATHMTYDLRENYNIFCSIVVYPVVPKGVIMLRLIPTAVHTLEDVETTINAFKSVKSKLDSGDYRKETLASVS